MGHSETTTGVVTRMNKDLVPRARGLIRPLVGALVSLAVTELTAWLALLYQSLGPSHEYVALLVWSLPVAALVFLIGAWTKLRPADRLVPRGLLAVFWGIVVGWGWSFLAYYLSGGWVMAFDVPVLWCWTYGAAIGLLVAWMPVSFRGLSSAAISLGLVVAISAAVVWRTRQIPILMVYVRPSATPAQSEAIFDTVLGNPDPRGGHSLLNGIRDIDRNRSHGDTTLIRVTFDWSASRRDRDAVIHRLQGSPAVVRYAWIK